ncbi:MAG: hypothetical protein HUU35_06265 [Armatimonadetes bacterium]|nr:hypothetical protein [Armatimonadota bacterium]
MGRWWIGLLLAGAAWAGEYPRELVIHRGSTPLVDGVIAAGEYDDAVTFSGVEGWTPQFTPTTDPADLALQGWAKHDGRDLYFAFRVTDNLLYGLDTARWLPRENRHAHELSRRGFPWFGDEMELLINATNRWSSQDNQNAAGDGTSWQMVCSLTKSRLGGVGPGGLLEGEPRAKKLAWDTYQRWILDGDMVAVARRELPDTRFIGGASARFQRPNHAGGSYVIEWLVRANPCLEVAPGQYWSPALGETQMGLNIALGDLDTRSAGRGNFGNFHHEDWWAGEKNKRTWLKQYGTLTIMPGPKPVVPR